MKRWLIATVLVWIAAVAIYAAGYVESALQLPDLGASYERTWQFQLLAFVFRRGLFLAMLLGVTLAAEWLLLAPRPAPSKAVAVVGAAGIACLVYAGLRMSSSPLRCAVVERIERYECIEASYYTRCGVAILVCAAIFLAVNIFRAKQSERPS